MVVEREAIVEQNELDAGEDAEAQHFQRTTETLRWTFEQGAMLRRSEQLRGGLLLLPRADGGRTVAMLSKGIRFDAVEDLASARRVLSGMRESARATQGPVPKPLVDMHFLIARHLARESAPYVFLEANDLADLSAARLLSIVQSESREPA